MPVTIAEIEQDAKESAERFGAVLAKFGQLDKIALADYDAVMAHPEAKELFGLVANLVKIGPIPGTIASIGGVVAGVLNLFQPVSPSASPAAALAA